MDWFTRTENLALIVAAASLLAWIWFAFRNHALQQRVVDLETAREKDKRRKEREADLRAEIAREMGRSQMQELLRITHHGQATARNVRVTIDGRDLLTHSVIPRGVRVVDTIGRHSWIDYLMAPSMTMRGLGGLRLPGRTTPPSLEGYDTTH
jgi:hypothetical protein